MIVKIVLCVTLLIFTSGIGYVFALKYRKRKQFFSQFYDFNERFLRELEYSRRPLTDFIQNCLYKGEFSDLLSIFLMNSDIEMPLQDYFSSITFLKLDEEKTISQFFNELGKGDCESQKKVFGNYLKDLGHKKTETNSDYKKYAELYVKLGVLVGISIIILIL